MNRNISNPPFTISKHLFKERFIFAEEFRRIYRILFKQKNYNTESLSLKRKIALLMFKPLMCTEYGRKIRKAFPVFRPWCKEFPRRLNILSDGSVTTCCVDTSGKNSFGSVYENDIAEIWNNRVKNILFGDLYNLKKCRECIGSRRTSLLSKRTDYLQWQSFAYQYPEVIQLEIMAKCNYGCCCANKLYKYRNNNEIKLDLDKAFENIRSFLPKIKQLNLFNCGESLLHDGFCNFVKKCRSESNRLYMKLCTNGMLMDEKISRCLIEQKVDFVSVSIHSGPGTENMLKYAKYGADYGKVMTNIKQLTGLRKLYKSELPTIETNTMLFNWNDTDELMDCLRKDMQAAGADKIRWTLNRNADYFWKSSKRFSFGSDELKRLLQSGI